MDGLGGCIDLTSEGWGRQGGSRILSGPLRGMRLRGQERDILPVPLEILLSSGISGHLIPSGSFSSLRDIYLYRSS